jgi:PST family polysaccharide transporter
MAQPGPGPTAVAVTVQTAATDDAVRRTPRLRTIFRLPTLSPVAWLTVDRVTQQGLWLILFAILAPILGPRPYGLFAIVMVFVGFCEFILLEGAVEALVTLEDLDHLHTTAANVANTVIAVAFGMAMAVLAPVLGRAFHDEEMPRVIWALAPLPLMSSLSAVPIAVLRRSLQYKQLAVRSILGLVIGGVLGIVLALSGAGVWALVFQVIGQRAAELVIAWIAVPVRLGWTWSAPHFRDLRPVAVNVFTARMMTLVGGQFPRIVLGYAQGPTEVGLFALANRFVDVIIFTTVVPRTAVGRIELRGAKPGSETFAQDFARMVQNVSVLSFPIFLGLASLVPELFRLWLDQRWQAGIVPTQLIVLSGVPLVLFYSIDAALLAAGQSDMFRRMANLQGVSVAVTVLCTAPFGLDITCLALAVRPWVLLPVLLAMFGRACRIPAYRVMLPPLRSLVGAVLMAAVLGLPFLHPTWLNGAVNFGLLVIVGVSFYTFYLYCVARGELRAVLADVFSFRS